MLFTQKAFINQVGAGRGARLPQGRTAIPGLMQLNEGDVKSTTPDEDIALDVVA